jgi:hypothetical protein
MIVDEGISKEGVLAEAEFFGVHPAVQYLREVLERERQPQQWQYLVVNAITLYQGGRARVDVHIDGPISRRRKFELEGMGLTEALNVLGVWGWKMRSSSGALRGGQYQREIDIERERERERERVGRRHNKHTYIHTYIHACIHTTHFFFIFLSDCVTSTRQRGRSSCICV